VDRPHNGHRRHDTGSITVVDLIRRQQQGPVRIPSADEAATVQFVDDLLGPAAEHDQPPRGWMSKSAKLAGLALGSLALCGSVVAASTLTHHRAQTLANASATVLTGAGALRPDTVVAELSGRRATHSPTVAPASHPAAPKVSPGRAVGTVVDPPSTAVPPPTGTSPEAVRSSQAPDTSHLTSAQLVRAFYRLVGTNPNLATTLLSPALLAADPNGFDRAWASMTDVSVENIQQNEDGSVQAVIRMLDPDGTWLQVVELLHVTDGDNPLITGAELLSAQRG
jgi:hypothetical protein